MGNMASCTRHGAEGVESFTSWSIGSKEETAIPCWAELEHRRPHNPAPQWHTSSIKATPPSTRPTPHSSATPHGPSIQTMSLWSQTYSNHHSHQAWLQRGHLLKSALQIIYILNLERMSLHKVTAHFCFSFGQCCIDLFATALFWIPVYFLAFL